MMAYPRCFIRSMDKNKIMTTNCSHLVKQLESRAMHIHAHRLYCSHLQKETAESSANISLFSVVSAEKVSGFQSTQNKNTHNLVLLSIKRDTTSNPVLNSAIKKELFSHMASNTGPSKFCVGERSTLSSLKTSAIS